MPVALDANDYHDYFLTDEDYRCVNDMCSEYHTVPSLGGHYSSRYVSTLSFLVAGGFLFDGWGCPVVIERGGPLRGWGELLDCDESYEVYSEAGLCIGTVPVEYIDALPLVALPIAVG
jgi:hypothetical protein